MATATKIVYYYEHGQEIEAELGEDEGWDEEHETSAVGPQAS